MTEEHISVKCSCGSPSIVRVNTAENTPAEMYGWCMNCCQRDLVLGRKIVDKMKASVPDMANVDFEAELEKMLK